MWDARQQSRRCRRTPQRASEAVPSPGLHRVLHGATLGAMQWLSARQVAAKIGVHHTTIYRQAKAGKIAADIKQIEVIRIPWDEKRKRICQAK